MRKIASLAVLMLLCIFAFAQTRTVKGTIKDDKGESIPFATITEAGTKNATTADADGAFLIKIKEGAKLNVSATGFNATTATPGAGGPGVLLPGRGGPVHQQELRHSGTGGGTRSPGGDPGDRGGAGGRLPPMLGRPAGHGGGRGHSLNDQHFSC